MRLEKKWYQDFLNSMSLALNSIQGHLTFLCLKKEAQYNPTGYRR